MQPGSSDAPRPYVPRGPRGDGTDSTHAGPGGAGRGPEEGKKGAGVDESGGPRDGLGEDEAPAAGMLRGNVEWSGMGRVRRLQDGYEENRFFQSVGLSAASTKPPNDGTSVRL